MALVLMIINIYTINWREMLSINMMVTDAIINNRLVLIKEEEVDQ